MAEREEFTRRYLPVVRSYLAARWRHGPMQGDVDDGVQEVFVACFKEHGALSRANAVTRGFRAFLLGVARNTALHMERTRARRSSREHAGIGSEVMVDDASLSRIYDRSYARAIMREAAAHMTERAGEPGSAGRRRVELLRLRFEEGLPIRDIARLWRREPDEIHREYAKAGREFRSALRDVVGISERCAQDRLDRECDMLLGLLR